MKSQPLVSVIGIFWNTEQFIQEAIESVLAQTYDHWELLLVDDGSSDGSTAIARHYAEQDPERVRYVEHPGHENGGASAARNLGLKRAKGDYIALLDTDDVWLPGKLEQQVAIMESQPEAAMVYGLSQYWYSWTGKAEDRDRDFVHELGVPPYTLIQPPNLIVSFFFEQVAAIPGPTNILVRREAMERVGGFDEQFKVYTDQAFYAKICLKSAVFASDKCWDRYRQHENSCGSMVERTRQEYSTRLFFLNWLAAYLADQGVQDLRIWQGVRKELWRCHHPKLSRLVRQGKRLRRW